VTDLRFAASGPDIFPVVKAVGAWPPFSDVPEKIVLDARTEKPGTAGWLEVARTCKRSARMVWSEATGKSLYVSPGADHRGSVSGQIPEYPLAAAKVLADFATVPFELGTLMSPFDEWHKHYQAPSFGDQQGLLGWGCMFKGAGHDRLVSRRWLDFGPWLVHRGPDDTTLVQFHDLAASLEQAIEQARPGHQRMGITKTGGFIQTDYVFTHKPNGLYAAADRSLRILINGRDVPQIEMLDAAAYRSIHRGDADQPVESLRFIFVDGEQRARAHLHELWLRELECWAIVDGVEKRLDADYHPARLSPPAWASGRGSR
jgi:hypothetical protein